MQNVSAGSDTFGMRLTPQYLELEMRLDDGSCLIFYIAPGDPGEVAFIVNLEDEIEVLMDDIADAPPANLARLAHEYPTFVQLVRNGEQGNYTQGVLVPFQDFDTGAEKIVIMMVVRNVVLERPETWLGPTSSEHLQRMMALAFAVLDEEEERTTITL